MSKAPMLLARLVPSVLKANKSNNGNNDTSYTFVWKHMLMFSRRILYQPFLREMLRMAV